jgi:hypothetical protein
MNMHFEYRGLLEDEEGINLFVDLGALELISLCRDNVPPVHLNSSVSNDHSVEDFDKSEESKEGEEEELEEEVDEEDEEEEVMMRKEILKQAWKKYLEMKNKSIKCFIYKGDSCLHFS